MSATAALAHKLRARDTLTAEEEQILERSVAEIREVPPARVIVRNGQRLVVSTLLIDGIVCRYKDLADGERQIQQLHVAGDFVDLHGFLLKRLDHSISALSHCRLGLVPHAALKQITEEHPHLARMLWFSTVLDASIVRETLVSIGRRTALARIAHLMCELSIRLGAVLLADRTGFDLSMTQTDLADATGLTPVHVNRMLKQLREQGIVTFRQGRVTIHDWERLVDVAEFDANYLHLEQLSL